ncbi:MAG: DoxX family protein [Melioribacteraceae bacterium]|nr:DoxX family protein [Melioribacteraceae bacterium]
MLFGHGLGKFNRLISGNEIKFFDPFGIGEQFSLALAVFAEFFAAGLIILGISTRISSVSLIITMFMAGVIYHADDPFGSKEKALMYLASYILLFITGPGIYSLGTIVKAKIKSKSRIIRFLLS